MMPKFIKDHHSYLRKDKTNAMLQVPLVIISKNIVIMQLFRWSISNYINKLTGVIEFQATIKSYSVNLGRNHKNSNK